MHRISAPKEVGQAVRLKPGQWVQTERKAHEIWASFCMKKPTASAVLHHLVAQMGYQNAVVISQKTLAKLLGVTDRTIRTAIGDLVADRWIQVVRIGKGKESAYVVNACVAWGQPRNQLSLSVFSAMVVADISDQDTATLESINLRRIPVLYPHEKQIPTGDGLAPPSQPSLEGLESDLPHILQEDESNYRGSGFSKADLIMAAAYDDFPELFEKQKKIKK
jgi:hypothetical protein